MLSKFSNFLLTRLLAKRLGIIQPMDKAITDLSMDQYAQVVFADNDLETVGEALIAYCLHHSTPGIGDNTWNDFLNQVC